mgnify:CR=1 FL=1|tara:strand:+ start:165 stop:488 length:324 start_codon:yes stop_codon:yes gene_type:complete
MKTLLQHKNKHTALFAVNTTEQLEEIKKITCLIFGGYTLSKTFGGWTDENKNLLEETSYKLEILTDKQSKYIENLSQHIAQIAQQSEVYFYTKKVNLNIVQNFNHAK